VNLDVVTAHFRFQLDQHGLPALVGLLMIAAAIGLQTVGVTEVLARTEELRREQVASRQRQAQKLNPEDATSKRIAGFYADLPTPVGALEAIEAIHNAAQANGVKLAHGEYRMTREGSAPLLRYQMTLPARASYPNLRAWIGDVMNTIPTAALDEISFRREDVGNDSVEARVRMTLFLRAD